MTILAGIMLLALATINTILARAFMYPPAIFSALWSSLLLALAASGSSFYPLSFDALAVYFFGALAFSLGGAIALLIGPNLAVPSNRFSRDGENLLVEKVLNYGLLGAVIIAPFFVRKLMSMSSAMGVENILKGVRIATSFEAEIGAGLGLYSYIIALITFLTLVAYYENNGTMFRKLRTFCYILTALIFQIMTASRTGAILIVLSLTIISVMKHGRLRLRIWVTGLALFMTIFTIPAILLGKGGSIEEGILWNMAEVAESIRTYTLAGTVAFSNILHEGVPNFGHYLSSRSISAILNLLGANIEIPSLYAAHDYTYTPAPTNVYTMYYYYYADFGTGGTVILMLLLGIMCTFVYLLAKRGDPPWVIIYAIIVTSLLLSGLNEPFFSAASFWIQAFFIIFTLYSRKLHRVLA